MEISIRNINRFSYSASIGFHIILFLILLLVNVSFEYQPKDYVELSFGITGGTGSSGTEGVAFDDRLEKAELHKQETTKDKNLEVKEVELPKAKNTDVSDVSPAKKDKEVKKETTSQTEERTSNNPPGDKKGNLNQGTGDFGYHFEGGGLGTRKIYSYVIPTYPEGVNKNIEPTVPSGLIVNFNLISISLLTKADTRLENAAINSLWQWRFEELSPNQAQVDQTAIIVFPYRLQ